MPHVSIGLPVYNGEKYVRKAIESILAQTLKGFELIISDNASTDRTEQICREYLQKDQRIRYYRNETNLGAVKNYNRLFELSTGDYFKWAAHDDICAPDFLKCCIEILESAPSRVVLCYPKTILIDENGNKLQKYDDKMDIRFKRPEDRLCHVFQNLWLCNCVFGLIRASALKATRLIGNYVATDVVLLSELSLLGEFWEIPDYLFFRRIHPGRSWQANRTEGQIARWFDPAKQGNLVPPKCRLFFEYFMSINRSNLTWREKVGCYSVVMDKWFKKYWRHMGGECKSLLWNKLRPYR